MKALPSRPSGARRLAALAILSHGVLATTMQAHPGHHPLDHGPLHLVVSPDHLAMFALGAVLFFTAALVVGRRVARRVLVAAGAATLALWMLLWISPG